MSKQTLAGIIAVLLIVFAGIGFWVHQESQQKPAGELKKLTLGLTNSFFEATVFIAEEKGFFREEGLDLTILNFPSGKAGLSAMLSGEGVDISSVAPFPIVLSSFERKDFAVLATFVYSYDNIKLIVNKNSGIQSGADLKGKKIGTPFGTSGEFFINTFLTYHSLGNTDITAINLPPSDLPIALKENQVDAIVIWEPHAYQAQKLLQENAVQLPSSEIYRESFNFLVMKDYAEENSDTLKRFLKACQKATDYINNHKTEAQKIVIKRLSLDQEVTSTLWEDFVFKITLDQSLLISLEDEARWLIRSKKTDKKEIPNYLNFVLPEVLKAVNPNSVTLIH
ncbi:MAG: NrtA/SsuA/CpmA family ABC transporter substrate-binding protein [SAR324 cluster bacterium]|nr:NrtA/SsuA/CpmA family ABC transporter substrate-binding protein [SAR324 cluster bacterium]